MRAKAPWTILIFAMGSAAGWAHAAAQGPDLREIRLEDGGSASSYTSQHRLKCGTSTFELTIESPRPARLTELKIDGKSVSSVQLNAVNALIPELSSFNRITSSCTSTAQFLTLRISTPSGELKIPLSFEQGVLKPVAGELPTKTP
ncbi:hypothetical protein [Stenotrophomonas maltophilia]|uniref:hypothetical protein n=1 Tax=Stenotrophomonas maltophilia TaxID=40324 RepID=UPI0034D3A525